MQRFRNILYVTDTSLKDTAALDQAVDLAERNGAELTIVEVMDRLSVLTTRQTASIIRRVRVRERKAELAELVSGISGRVKAKSEILEGRAFLEIIRKVMSSGHDLVIKPAGGRARGLGRLFSSTDLHLLRKCPCPVWLIKPVKPKRKRRIFAAVDFDDVETGDVEQTLNRQIVELAISLAHMQGCDLRVLHVWDPFLGRMLASPRAGLAPEQVVKYVKDEKAAHSRQFESLMRDAERWVGRDVYGAVDPATSMVKGQAGPTIVQQVRTHKADLLIMGTVGRGGVEGLLIGNTAEQILDEIECSVLAVKPPGFISPVRLPERA